MTRMMRKKTGKILIRQVIYSHYHPLYFTKFEYDNFNSRHPLTGIFFFDIDDDEDDDEDDDDDGDDDDEEDEDEDEEELSKLLSK